MVCFWGLSFVFVFVLVLILAASATSNSRAARPSSSGELQPFLFYFEPFFGVFLCGFAGSGG